MKYLNTYNENKEDNIVVITDIPHKETKFIIKLIEEKYDIEYSRVNFKENFWVAFSKDKTFFTLDDGQRFDKCWSSMKFLLEYVSFYKDSFISCDDWLKKEYGMDLDILIQGNKLGLL